MIKQKPVVLSEWRVQSEDPVAVNEELRLRTDKVVQKWFRDHGATYELQIKVKPVTGSWAWDFQALMYRVGSND